MCAVLMQMGMATEAELRAAIARKLKKFGNLQSMPKPTRDLVHAGMLELGRRQDAVRVKRP